MPFFITRTAGDELACKIVHYTKPGWEQTAISLPGTASRKLYDALGAHLAVADHSTGSYVVVKTDGSVGDVSDLNLSDIANAIAQLLSADGVTQHLSRLDLGADPIGSLGLHDHHCVVRWMLDPRRARRTQRARDYPTLAAGAGTAQRG